MIELIPIPIIAVGLLIVGQVIYGTRGEWMTAAILAWVLLGLIALAAAIAVAYFAGLDAGDKSR